MRNKSISETISNINPKYINEATTYNTDEKKIVYHTQWVKFGTVAACLALVVALSIMIIFGGAEQVANLDNGDTIKFIKTEQGLGESDIAFWIETRDLNENEIKMLFGDLPVNAYALFNVENGSILGIEGEVNGMRLVVSGMDVSLVDAVIDGEENTSNVDGVSVNAGYFIDDTSRGKNIIYYATFSLGESIVYVEHAGTKDKSEKVKNEIADMILKLIELREINLNQISK